MDTLGSVNDEEDDYEIDQLQPEETLADTELTDVLDRGYSPPDRDPGDREHETLDERLAEEEPDLAVGDYDADFPSDAEVGGRRAGRLIAPDMGTAVDVDAQLLATDAGVDGAGASAEEAAVHIIEPE